MSAAAELELQRVRGPSAVGGGWKRFAELLYLLSVTEFKRTYFGTVLGYLWSLLRPLLLFAVLLFVFTKIFRLGHDVPHYPVLLLFNVVLFGFFSEATQGAVQSVVTQESVVRKTQFPRMVIPLSVVFTGLFNLGMNLIVVLVFILAFGVSPMWTWLLFPLIVGGAVRLRHRRVAAALLALRPLSRHGDHLDGDGDGALLRDPGPLPDREGAGRLRT